MRFSRVLECWRVFVDMERKHAFRGFAAMSVLAGVTVVHAQAAVSEEHTDAGLLGSHVLLFDPAMPTAEMQERIDRVYALEEHAEFGPERYALLFKPGEYHLGFYTQVMGLGASPDAVHITGNVHADASLPKNNATCTFWRSAENFSVTPTGGTLQWAVSQAVAFRRMHVHGDMVLHQHRGWASGGWISDAVIDGNVDSGSQQQFLSRNAEWKSWTGASWNMMFVGVPQAPAGEWPKPPYTRADRTPVIREKPFLVMDDAGHYAVRVPALRRDRTGVSWHGVDEFTSTGNHRQRSAATIPLDRFYIARPGQDTAATINAALRRGKHLLLLPGVFDITEPIRVLGPHTVVLGLGFATLHPVTGQAAMTVADVDGVSISGLLIDAGEKESPVLMEVGVAGQHRSHAADPITLHDIFFRGGGAGPGRAGTDLLIHSDSTIVDHTWIWRADHGKNVGWTENTSRVGIEVDGNDVVAYGLFVEHHQEFQVLWKGERGRTYFYQSEIPYDPPTQAAWKSAPGVDGWASYKVADGVKQHTAMGLGIYSVFRQPEVKLTHAIEVPQTPGVVFEHMVTVALDDKGEITHVVNDTGDAATPRPHMTLPRVTRYPARP